MRSRPPPGPGFQGALLAPTDLLARQHLETVGGAAGRPRRRRHPPDRVAQGRGAAQADRGHRLGPGVGRRRHPRPDSANRSRSPDSDSPSSTSSTASASSSAAQLEAKAGGGMTPHVLLMTATPIPRTLGQVLYADLDVSDLRTPPAGRVPDPDGHPCAGSSSRRPGRRCGSRQPPDTGRSSSCRSSRRAATAPTTAARRGRGRRVRSGTAARPCWRPLRVGLVHGRLKAARSRRRDDAGSATASWTSSSARPSSRSGSTCPRRR